MSYDVWAVSIRLVTGLVIGFLIALTGVGGGALAVPALSLILDVPSSMDGRSDYAEFGIGVGLPPRPRPGRQNPFGRPTPASQNLTFGTTVCLGRSSR